MSFTFSDSARRMRWWFFIYSLTRSYHFWCIIDHEFVVGLVVWNDVSETYICLLNREIHSKKKNLFSFLIFSSFDYKICVILWAMGIGPKIYFFVKSQHSIMTVNVAFDFGLQSLHFDRFYSNLSIKGSKAQNQRTHEALWILWFDEKLYLKYMYDFLSIHLLYLNNCFNCPQGVSHINSWANRFSNHWLTLDQSILLYSALLWTLILRYFELLTRLETGQIIWPNR